MKLYKDNTDKSDCRMSHSEYIFKPSLKNLKGINEVYEPDNIKFYTHAKLMIMSDDEIMEIKPYFIILCEYHRTGAEMWNIGIEKS